MILSTQYPMSEVQDQIWHSWIPLISTNLRSNDSKNLDWYLFPNYYVAMGKRQTVFFFHFLFLLRLGSFNPLHTGNHMNSDATQLLWVIWACNKCWADTQRFIGSITVGSIDKVDRSFQNSKVTGEETVIGKSPASGFAPRWIEE